MIIKQPCGDCHAAVFLMHRATVKNMLPAPERELAVKNMLHAREWELAV